MPEARKSDSDDYLKLTRFQTRVLPQPQVLWIKRLAPEIEKAALRGYFASDPCFCAILL